MSSPLVPTVRGLFDRITTQPEGTKGLQEYDQLLQFTILNGTPLLRRHQGGKVTITEGTAAPRPLMEAHVVQGPAAGV